jgi:hypothetical protein
MELNNKVNNYTKQNELKKSFNDILLLSEYPTEIIKKNLINIKNIQNIENKNNNVLEVQLEINENKEYINETQQVIIEELPVIKNNKSILVHKDVNYKNKKYTVGYCSFKDTEDILFVIDYDKKDFVIKNKWRYNNDTKYICKTYVDIEGNSKWLHLHSFIMNGLVFDQGHAISIDHINQIKRDNRLENLRKLTQSDQNVNRGKLLRKIELPEGCGIDPQDIPTNIYFRASDGAHGDRFYIDIKNVDPQYRWYSSGSKLIDLKTKLQQTILMLEEYKKKNPQYANLLFDLKDVQTRNDLRKSFNEILQLSKFPQEIIDKNLVEIEEEIVGPIKKIDEDAKDLAKQLVEQGFKGVASNLPQDCGVTPNMMPKYCYYKPASDKRGDKFIIERHPKLVEKGLRQWATTEAKTKTTKQKFDLMIQKLIELEN